jgi:hypothetical protein
MRQRYTLADAERYARRLADRAAWHSGGAVEYARTAIRQTLARAGVPVKPEFLELGCAAGNEASGLFSEFCAVVGCLHYVERHPEVCAGLRVDFASDGLYYEADRGSNWWEYYFEPIHLGAPDDARLRRVPLWQHDAFAEGVEHFLTRESAADIVRRHVRLRQGVIGDVNGYCENNFRGRVIIGAHYRGTDKYEESAPVDYQVMIDAIRAAMNGERLLVFIATDDARFLQRAVNAFQGDVLFRNARRSLDGTAVHKNGADGYCKGYEAVVDCYLLSRCTRLVRTSSNLGLVASLINPSLPVELVTNP